MNCTKCSNSGWVELDGGMARCACRKKKAVVRQELGKRAMTELVIAATEAANSLSAIPDYPWDKEGRKMIGDALVGMCATPEQVLFVVRRAIALHTSWKRCAVPGLRQILCSRYPTRDGIEITTTEAFPEGIPSESDGRTGYEQLEATKMRELPEAAATGDSNFAKDLWQAAQKKRLKAVAPRVDEEFAKKLDALDRGYAVGGDK